MPFHSIDDPATLRRLLDATLLIEADLELTEILGHVVEEACAITGAKYGALGVLDEQKQTLAEFVTRGLTAPEEAAIGPRPTGRGVLGLLIAKPDPLRLDQISEHPESFGFPPDHPRMSSFLGAPVRVRGEVYGNLYLAEKEEAESFTERDVAAVNTLAIAAGIAIENARLHEQVRRVAVFEDRDRMARDLHDTVIQRLFGLGLTLQGIAARLPASTAGPLGELVEEVDSVIAQVRSTIYELGMRDESRGVQDDVRSLVHELHDVLGFPARVDFDGPLDTVVSHAVREQLLAIIREGLTNVGKHARATEATVRLEADGSSLTLTIADNGVGHAAVSEAPGGGLGLPNLRRRVEKLNGTFSIEADEHDGSGTVLSVRVPLDG